MPSAFNNEEFKEKENGQGWKNFMTDTMSLIPFIGGALGNLIQRKQSQKDIERQNEYNSPKAQLARMREAGLPMAAMTGVSSSQASLPMTNEGVAKGISGYFATAAAKKQLELLDAQIKNTQVSTLKTAEEANRVAYDLQLDQIDPEQGQPVSYKWRMMNLDYQMKQVAKEIQQNSKEISDLDLKVHRELTEDGTISSITRNQLQGMINGVELGRMQINKGKALDTLIEIMKQGGIKLHEAILMAIMQSQIGPAGGIHFPDYNPRNTNINVTGEQYHEHIRH